MGAGTLAKRTLFASKIEATEGTAETLASADVLPVLAPLAVAHEQDSVERDLLRGTLTYGEDVSGLKGGTVAPQLELAGHVGAHPANLPFLDRLIRAAGFKRTRPATVTYTNRLKVQATWTAGTFVRHDQVMIFDDATDTGSGATARVIGDYYPGDEALFLELLTGVPAVGDTQLENAGETIVIPISGPGNGADEAFSYEPVSQEVSSIHLSAVASGPIDVNDELLGGTSGARAYCVQATSGAGAQDLYYELFEDSGNFQSGETISVVGGSATGTTDAAPIQVDMPSLTVATYDAQQMVLKGARCGMNLRLTNGDRGVLTFPFDGVGTPPVDAPVPAWPGDASAKPPAIVGSRIEVRKRDGTGSAYLPLFKEMTINVENELTRIDFPGDSSTAGFKSTKIGDRKVTGTFDPRTVKEAVMPLLGSAWNKDPIRVSGKIGAGLGDGNTVEFQAPMALFQSPTKDADARIVRVTVPFACRGLGDDEFFLHFW